MLWSGAFAHHTTGMSGNFDIVLVCLWSIPHALLSYYATRAGQYNVLYLVSMLTGACNRMLCPIHLCCDCAVTVL